MGKRNQPELVEEVEVEETVAPRKKRISKKEKEEKKGRYWGLVLLLITILLSLFFRWL